MDIKKMPVIGKVTTKELKYTLTDFPSGGLSEHTMPAESYSVVHIFEDDGQKTYVTNEWYKEYKKVPLLIIESLVDTYEPTGDKFADGGGVEFIEYKDSEIMFEPYYKEYFVGDEQFSSLEDAQKYIDEGSQLSQRTINAYRHGAMKDGGGVGEFKVGDVAYFTMDLGQANYEGMLMPKEEARKKTKSSAFGFNYWGKGAGVMVLSMKGDIIEIDLDGEELFVDKKYLSKVRYANGGGVGSDKWQIKNEADKYYSIDMRTFQPAWNESPDLGYSFVKGEAESIKNKLTELGFAGLSVVEYNPNWWKMEEGGYLHGSPNDFCDTGFKLGAGQGQGENLWGRGHYFTNDKDLATYYAKFIVSEDVDKLISQKVADKLGFKTYNDIPYDYDKKGIRTKYGEHLKFDLYHQYLKQYVDKHKDNGIVYEVTLFPGKDKKDYKIIDFSGENYTDDDVRKKDKRDLKNLIDTLSKNKRTYAKAVKLFFDKKNWEFDLEKYNEKFADTLKSMRDYYNNFDSYSASTPLLYNLGYDIKRLFDPRYFDYAKDYKVIYDKIKSSTDEQQSDLRNEEAYYKGVLFTEFIKDAGYDALKYSFSPSIIPYKNNSEYDARAIVVYDDENVEIDNCKVAEDGMMMTNGGTISDSIDLFFQEGGSDKEYHIQLVGLGDGTYVVNFQFGRRGSKLNSGTKTATPVPLDKAQKIYDSLKREKMNKGYEPDFNAISTAAATQVKPQSKTVHILPQLLNPVEEYDMYIDDDTFLAQEKKDYERRIIISDGKGGIMGLNKKGQEVPVPKKIAQSITDECILDGEISADKYYVFDIISFEGKDLKHFSTTQRLEYLYAMDFGLSVEKVETAYTAGEKALMYEVLKAENREGIVFKKKGAPYTPGRPNSGGSQLKYKFYKTATFIVANMTKDKRSVGLELIDDNTGARVPMGKVTIPPNFDVPDVGDLVEVRYLYAYKGGSAYQPVYLGKRNDSDLTDATMKQIVFKAEDEFKDGGYARGELKPGVTRGVFDFKNQEFIFTDDGSVLGKKKGETFKMGKRVFAELMGAEDMNVVGETNDYYTFELTGNTEDINKVAQEKNLDIETWGTKKRVTLPKELFTNSELEIKFPAIYNSLRFSANGTKINKAEDE